jgi:hypothetical protein
LTFFSKEIVFGINLVFPCKGKKGTERRIYGEEYMGKKIW